MNRKQRLQLDLEQCLLSLPALAHVAITNVRPRTAGAAAGIMTQINNTLAGVQARNGKKGCAIIVGMPVIGGVNPNLRAVKGELVLELAVIENILVNEGADGTGLTAEDVADEICLSIPQMVFHPFGQLLADKALVTPRTEAVFDKRIEYKVRLTCFVHDQPRDKCTPPVITRVGDQITLTGSGDIYYTADESYPGPGNFRAETDGSHTLLATLYTAPITQTAAVDLRAACHDDDKVPSDVVAQSFDAPV